jgi:hypothetical protein
MEGLGVAFCVEHTAHQEALDLTLEETGGTQFKYT